MVTFAGNLAETPQLETSATGKPTVRMRIAVDTRRRDGGGEWIDGPTSWYTVIAWEHLAENLAAHVAKGDRLLVHGRLEQREWTTDAGETRTVWEVTAEDAGPSLRMPNKAATNGRGSAPAAKPAPQRSGGKRWPARAGA